MSTINVFFPVRMELYLHLKIFSNMAPCWGKAERTAYSIPAAPNVDFVLQ